MEINLQGKDSVTVINAYAPISSAEDEKVEQFYDDIERAMADSDSRYKIFTGDFNAKIGTKTKEDDFKSMGALGIGERNKRGDRLIEFAEEHNLIIANTLFQNQKPKTKTKQKTNKQTNKQNKTKKKTKKPPKKQKTKTDPGLGSSPAGETRNQTLFYIE